MRDWFWFIAQGAIITVELTVISIVLASLLALLGSLGRLSRKMSFKQAWRSLPELGLHGPHGLGRIPYWIATFYTSLFRGTPLLLQIIAIYSVIPGGDQVLRSAVVIQSAPRSGQASPPSR